MHPLGASRYSKLSVNIRRLIYAYCDYYFLVKSIAATNWFERKSLMSESGNEGFLLRDNSIRIMNLSIVGKGWTCVKKDANKPKVAVKIKQQIPFIR